MSVREYSWQDGSSGLCQREDSSRVTVRERLAGRGFTHRVIKLDSISLSSGGQFETTDFGWRGSIDVNPTSLAAFVGSRRGLVHCPWGTPVLVVVDFCGGSVADCHPVCLDFVQPVGPSW